ncbi:type II toxin-antitoxin system VapC family toxin [Candidatus Woesearchaeota archaeon]|nr:type II toxin-antitoxin system VapC family toxin [Candidatus Woesearchaeota archaeon]
MRIVLDSTVLIDVERKNEEALELVKSMLANNEELIVSAVTISEVLTGVYYMGKRESLLDAKAVLAQFSPVPLDAEVADKTAQFAAFLLRNGSPIDFKDVAIAATFTVTKSDFLLTQNKKHFEIIPEVGGKARTVLEFRKIYR